MTKQQFLILGISALIVVALTSTVAGTWISAVNGEIQKEQTVYEAEGNVHVSLSGRYEKVDVFIDAINDANSAMQTIIDSITDARAAFAAAIASNNQAKASEAAENVDSLFVDLVVMMEDNPESYSTIGLYATFMAEFDASTNSVIHQVTVFNNKVRDYNTHIQIFPNFIFLNGKTPFEAWPVVYSTTLPSFNTTP